MAFHFHPFPYPPYNPRQVDQWLHTSALHYTYQRVTRLMLPPTHHWTDDWHISLRKVLSGPFSKHILVFYRPLYKTIMFTNCLEDDFQAPIRYYAQGQYLSHPQLTWILYLIVRTITWALDCASEPPRRFILLSNNKFLRSYFQTYMLRFDNTLSNNHIYKPTPGEDDEADLAWLYHHNIPELQVVCDCTDQSQLAVRDRSESSYKVSQLASDCQSDLRQHPLVEAGEERSTGRRMGSNEILSWLADLNISPQLQPHPESSDAESPPPETPDLHVPHPPAPHRPSPYATLLYPGAPNPQLAYQQAMSRPAPAGPYISPAENWTPPVPHWAPPVPPVVNGGPLDASMFPSVDAAHFQEYPPLMARSKMPLEDVIGVHYPTLTSTKPVSRLTRGAVSRRRPPRP